MEQPQDKCLRILHFNDVYELEEETSKMVAGLKAYREEDTQYGRGLTIFSGDVFSPTTISNQMQGTNMVLPLQQCGVDVATFGNHDFDHGIRQLENLCSQLNFPWVISNLEDRRKRTPLAKGLPHLILEHNQVKIGLMGLAEQEWFSILQIDTDKLVYHDFIQVAKEKVALFQQQECDLIIAITHMRSPNDRLLAESVPGLSLILGGHDHIIMDEQVNGCRIVKSGTNFQQFGVIDVVLSPLHIKVQCIETKSLCAKCMVTTDYVVGIKEKFERQQSVPLAYLAAPLDTCFTTVRAQESALGNFLADLCRIKLKADVAILNGGCLRTDCILPMGFISSLTILKILAIQDLLVVKKLSGAQLMGCVENSVSKYPSLEGRWPLLSNLSLSFDPSLPPGQRIVQLLFQGTPVEPHRQYSVLMKYFQAQGYDGYDSAKSAPYVLSPEAEILMHDVPIQFLSKVKQKNRLQEKTSERAKQKLAFLQLHGVNAEWFQVEGEQKQLYSLRPQQDGRITIL